MAWSQIPSCRLMISTLVSQGMDSFENSKAKPNTSKADLILPGLTQITIKVFAGRAFYLRVRQGTISFNKISSSCGKTNIIKNCPWCQLFKIKRQALQMQTKTHCHPKKTLKPEFQLQFQECCLCRGRDMEQCVFWLFWSIYKGHCSIRETGNGVFLHNGKKDE